MIRVPILQPREMIIDYVDAEKRATRRTILPRAIEGVLEDGTLNVVYIEAICRKARAQRSFRLDRIESIADAKTGELFDLDDWVRGLTLGPIHDVPEPSAPSPPPVEPVTVWRGVRKRWLLATLALGYCIGRWKLLTALATAIHWRALRGW